ncbi:hypothetical protein Bbelb_289340 [Branchiostoma belcheri]|nr:hypothetical protein Bbelb_289340 [Branchiostoma belcheri]
MWGFIVNFLDDFRVDCELCRHWGLSRRTGAKQNCAGGVEERRGRSRFFAGAKQNGAGAKQNGGGEEEGVSWGCKWNTDKPVQGTEKAVLFTGTTSGRMFGLVRVRPGIEPGSPRFVVQ